MESMMAFMKKQAEKQEKMLNLQDEKITNIQTAIETSNKRTDELIAQVKAEMKEDMDKMHEDVMKSIVDKKVEDEKKQQELEEQMHALKVTVEGMMSTSSADAPSWKTIVEDMVEKKVSTVRTRSAPPHQGGQSTPHELKAKVKGFPSITFADEAKAAATDILKKIGFEDYTKIYAPGWRTDKVYITFDNKEDYIKLMKMTRKQQYAWECDGEMHQLEIVKHFTPEEYERTKHTRTLTRIIGQLSGLQYNQDSWKILGADHHKRREVYLGKKVVGEFRKTNPLSPSSEPEIFHVNVEVIDQQKEVLGMNVSGIEVKAAFDEAIEQ